MLSRDVAAVGREVEFNAQGRTLARLQIHWDKVCPSARSGAGKRSVVTIGRLLDRPISRLPAVKLLMDVGENAKYVLPQLQKAIRAQSKEDLERARAASPYPIADPISSSLKGLRGKIETGKLDPDVCWFVIAAREADAQDGE